MVSFAINFSACDPVWRARTTHSIRADSQSSVNHVRVAITHTPTRLLFPYDLAADAPSGAHTPQVLAPSTLNAITRKQVVDVIVRLVRERAPIEARVIEIVLEYIGKKWHASEGDVECVARKLSEIVSDVSHHAGQSNARSKPTSRPSALVLLPRSSVSAFNSASSQHPNSPPASTPFRHSSATAVLTPTS